MRVVIVWREASDHAREVRSWIRDFENRTGAAIESVNPDEPEGISLCGLYGVVEYPTILALADNGSMLQMWRGTPMTSIDSVAYYVLGQ